MSDNVMRTDIPSAELPDNFRPDINALRALAVVAVVAYHYGVPGFGGGFAGVDVFFVISGFLIGGQILGAHARSKFSFMQFYLSRLRRIFPALAVMSVLSLLWGWFYVLPNDYLKTARHVLAALFFVSNLAFTGEQGYFDLAAHAKSMLHTWSLSVEGQFYVFLPIGLAIAWRVAHRHVGWLLFIAWGTSLVWCLLGGRAESANAFYLLSARAWEFLTGCLLAWWQMHHTERGERYRNVLALGSLLILLVSFFVLNPNLIWPGSWTVVPVFAAAALIAAGGAPSTRVILNSWVVQRLGDVSYSLYLWHWPVLVFAQQYSQTMQTRLSAVELLVLMFVSLIFASMSWRWVEQPIRAKNGWWQARRVWIGVLIVLVLVFVAGAYIVKTKGAPSRLPEYVQRASSAVFVNTPRDECFRRGDSTKDSPEAFCSFGATTSEAPQVLLWGDSHANQYLSALTEAAHRNGQRGLIATQGGCRATLAGQPSGLPESIARSCEHFNDEVNALLLQTPTLQTVVLGRLWSPDASIDRTTALVLSLVRAGKHVLLIGPLPEPGFDVPQRWSMQQIHAGHAIDDMVVPISSQHSALDMRTRLQTELAAPLRSGQVVLLDPMRQLCDESACRLVEAAQSNFRDTSHLSHTATLRFTQDLLAALQALKP